MEMFERGTGIVCEYNPFHKGHAYQINAVKKMGAQFVVCAMSGDFTQRGEPSFQDKYVRAENAVANGADVVLEIPFPFSSMSAEGFAKAGISILEKSGLCSSFAFGSECADVDKLCAVAGLLDKGFHKHVLELQKAEPNLAYALARERIVRQRLGEEFSDILKNPNDILAVEYLKANKSLIPIAVKRTTPRGGYDENFVSSSFVRKNLFGADAETARGGLPESVSLEGLFEDDGMFYKFLHLSLCLKTPSEIERVAEVPKGCEHSIIKNAHTAKSYDELCKLLASKTLTDAKIRRMLLFSLFGVTKEMLQQPPLYTQVLCASEKGRKMLKKYADDRKITVASRTAEIKKDQDAKKQYDFARAAFEVVSKCREV